MKRTTSKKQTRSFAPPLVPDRVRDIGKGGFSFFPNRFVYDGFFASLAPNELRLYVLLVLLGDRRGMSYWSRDALCSVLCMPLDHFLAAKHALIAKSLIAYQDHHVQVLQLPDAPIALPLNGAGKRPYPGPSLAHRVLTPSDLDRTDHVASR